MWCACWESGSLRGDVRTCLTGLTLRISTNLFPQCATQSSSVRSIPTSVKVGGAGISPASLFIMCRGSN